MYRKHALIKINKKERIPYIPSCLSQWASKIVRNHLWCFPALRVEQEPQWWLHSEPEDTLSGKGAFPQQDANHFPWDCHVCTRWTGTPPVYQAFTRGSFYLQRPPASPHTWARTYSGLETRNISKSFLCLWAWEAGPWHRKEPALVNLLGPKEFSQDT